MKSLVPLELSLLQQLSLGSVTTVSKQSDIADSDSFLLSPIFFAIAGAIWFFIVPTRKLPIDANNDAALSAVEDKRSKKNYFVQIGYGAVLFVKSIWVGGKIIFTSRKMVWLFPCYAIALYLHRFLEASLAPAFARRILLTSAWSQIMVGGSNFGELLGALTVFLLSNRVPTPIPWIRLDALALNVSTCQYLADDRSFGFCPVSLNSPDPTKSNGHGSSPRVISPSRSVGPLATFLLLPTFSLLCPI